MSGEVCTNKELLERVVTLETQAEEREKAQREMSKVESENRKLALDNHEAQHDALIRDRFVSKESFTAFRAQFIGAGVALGALLILAQFAVTTWWGGG